MRNWSGSAVMAQTLLAELSARGIRAYLENGKLKTQSPSGAITGELAALIKANKDEIISSLLQGEAPAPACASRGITVAIRSGDTAAVTTNQRLLWLGQKRSGASPLYNVSTGVSLRGSLDKLALTRALQKLVDRHEVLRTSFIEENGEVRARIHPALTLQIHEHRAGRSEATTLMKSLADKPFDLSSDPLLRADLIEVEATEHILVLCMHHIVTDAWSCRVLAKELEAFYNAALDDRDARLPELPLQFADYAEWLELPEQQQSFATGLHYWREQLRDLPPVHSLPLDHPRPRVQSYEGAVLESTLPEKLTEQVRAFAADQGTTVYVLLQSALALLLSRWSNERDIVIGTSSSGRNHPELQNLVGFFVNSLILRHRIPVRATVEDFVSSSKRLLLEAVEHQHVAFERIVEEVLPARSSSHAPLFQIMLNYENVPSSANIRFTKLDCELLWTGGRGSKYDIEITAADFSKSLHLQWAYATRLFSEHTVRRLQRSFELLLSQFIQSPRRCISGLAFLPPEELQFLAQHASGPVIPFGKETFPERFAASARQFPDAVAVEYRGRELRYAELDAQANQAAHYLRAIGLTPGERVAVYLEPSLELVIAILAILKAGGTYVPVDPTYPRERVDYILQDCGAKIVLSMEQMRQAALFADQPVGAPQLDIDGSSLAYILYTSGSTGKPKGVMIRHEGLSNYLTHASGYFSPEMQGAIVSSSICFDATITSLLTPLLLGKRVVLLESDLDAVFKGLKHYLLDDGTPWLFKLTPAHLSALSSVCAGHAPCDAKHILIIGGEQLDHALVDLWQSKWLPEATYVNEYGPTETVVGCSVFSIQGRDPSAAQKGAVPIGQPIANMSLWVIDEGRLVPAGVPGELYISGPGVAQGYVNAAELTGQRFVHLPQLSRQTRFYRTGDLVRLRQDGHLEFIKRCDEQVKIRGYRIEIGEIESALRGMEGVHEAAVVMQEDGHQQQRFLAAFLQTQQQVDAKTFLPPVRAALARLLPEYMVPSAFELIETLPLTVNGKIDKKALPKVDLDRSRAQSYAPPQSELEELLCRLWQTALGRERVGIHDNFIEIGGNSLLFVKLRADLESRLGLAVDITAFFEYPTIAELSRHLRSRTPTEPDEAVRAPQGAPGSAAPGSAIAVIAMSGRFPGAGSPEELWDNLRQGVETLQTFSDAELLASGFTAQAIAQPNFVRTGALIRGVEYFDADFFNMTPREAEVLDPQQRLLLECSVETLERAGYGNSDAPLRCGVFVGCRESTYFLHHLLGRPELIQNLGLNILYANSPSYTATRIAYKLNLRGPAVNIGTACSTSLVAIHQAINSLRLGECEMALAGGAGVWEFGASGYLYKEGGIESPDGRCRAFDQNARGTRGGNGAGIVLLKRLGDALRDNDTILAVIAGSAINNDGSQKAGYTAPGVAGQVDVIQSALRDAGVRSEQIQYVETHGTGTSLGDPVEFRALSKAFGESSQQGCALGTLKPNIGHLDAAAGVAGLIKTVQALRHATIPPCINFERPNEMIHLAGSPFYFTTQARDWPVAPGERRRAGVSAFGIGGTNVHMIVEEAPERHEPAEEENNFQLIPLSARTAVSLTAQIRELRSHRERHPGQRMSDVAFTLQVGRKAQPFRTFCVARHHEDLIAALSDEQQLKIHRHAEDAARPAVVFLFPGQGSQYSGMGLGLLGVARRFTEAFEQCRALIERYMALDILGAIQSAEGEGALLPTGVAQPALFAIEYGLAAHLMSLGVRPEAMLGHSLGELVAACLAGVFALEDALRLVCARARLMQACKPGAMLAVSAARSEAERFYDPQTVALAAVNGPKNYVLSGEFAQIDAIEARLSRADVACRKLHTSHAFHSSMMQDAAQGLRQEIKTISLQAPKIRFVSNVSGTFITEAEACDPDYWIRHLLSPVQFAGGLDSLDAELRPSREPVLVEVGPGNALATLARRNPRTAKHTIVGLMRHSREEGNDQVSLLSGLGSLWAAGCELNWPLHEQARKPGRVQLPTYPFERKRYWVDRADNSSSPGKLPTAMSMRPEDWFYLPTWRLSPPGRLPAAEVNEGPWLVLADPGAIADALAAHIPAGRERVVVPVPVGNPDIQRLCDELASRFSHSPALSVVCLWAIDSAAEADEDSYEGFRQAQRRCFHPLLKLLQTLSSRCPHLQVRLLMITDCLFRVTGEEAIRASLAPLRSLCKVMPQENPQVSCRLIDIDGGYARTESGHLQLARQLWQELQSGQNSPEVALRGKGRWLKAYEPLNNCDWGEPRQRLVTHGHYLITGGLGRIGLQLAMRLAKDYQSRITLLSRRDFPPSHDWERVEELALAAEVLEQVRWLRRIKDLGGDVQVIRADVSRSDELERGVSCAEEAFGSLNGVIHAAGDVKNSVVPLQHTDEEICDRQFASKVAGLINLDRLLQTRTVDFCLVMSSLSVELGGLGFTAYAAANSYADAFVQRMRNAGKDHWCSIDWDGWSFAPQDSLAPGVEHAMRAEEGIEAFALAMRHLEHPCLVNSTTDLRGRIEKWIRMSPQQSQPQSVYSRPDLSEDYLAPATQTQETLSRLWQEVLGIDRIGVNDNFFQLGGDSLIATRLVARIRAHFAVPNTVFSLADFFANPVIRAIADKLGDASVMPAADSTHASPQKIPRVDRSVPLPLSFDQQRLWFIDQLEGGSRQYNVSNVLKLTGRLDKSALQRSFDVIVQRHEVLRTTYERGADGPVQVVHEVRPVNMDEMDLSTLAPEQREVDLDRIIGQVANRTFDLRSDDMLRLTLVTLAPDQHALITSMHHIVSDAWSLGVMTKEFTALYDAFRRGQPDPLPPLALQYGDFACWQRNAFTRELQAGQLQYWRDRLRAAPGVHALPTDRPRTPRQTFVGSSYDLRIDDPDVLRLLNEMSTRTGATLFMILLSAWSLVLARWSNRRNIVIGTPIAGRAHEQLEPLIGIFLNSLALQLEVCLESTFEELLAQARRHALDAYANQDIPFEMLVDELQPRRSLAHSPLFQIMFTLQNTGPVGFELPNLKIEPLTRRQNIVKFDIEFMAGTDDRGLWLTWNYAQALFDPATLQNLGNSFEVLLRSLLQDPAIPMFRLPLLTRDDLEAFNRLAMPARSVAGDGHVLDLFAAQVRATPHALAVCAGDTRLSYAVLNEQVVRLANCLAAAQIGPGTRVLILLENVPLRVATLLALLWRGAVCLTVEPSMLRHSPAALIEQSGVSCVLTQTAHASSLSGLHERVLFLDTLEIDSAAAEALSSFIAPRSDTPALVTEDSFVELTHAALADYLHRRRDIAKMDRSDRTLLLPGACHFAPMEWLLPLVSGGQLHVMSTADCPSLDRVDAYIRREGITHLTIPAALLPHLPWPAEHRLQHLMLTGSGLAEATAWRWAGVCRVSSAFGPPALPAACVSTVEPDRPIVYAAATGVEIRILDPYMNRMPLGAVGEVHVCRQQVSDSHATGILGRQHSNGEVEVLGRVGEDSGYEAFGVPLATVERYLSRCGAVANVVLSHDTSDAGGRLTAFAIPASATTPAALPALQEQLRASLPDYMIPEEWVWVDELPVTVQGQIDRSAVIQPPRHRQRQVDPEMPRLRTDYPCKAVAADKVGQLDCEYGRPAHAAVSALAAASNVSVRDALLGVYVLLMVLHNGSGAACVAVGNLRERQRGYLPGRRLIHHSLTLACRMDSHVRAASVIRKVADAVGSVSVCTDGDGVNAHLTDHPAQTQLAYLSSAAGRLANDAGQFALTLMLDDSGDELNGRWLYDCGVFEARTIAHLSAAHRNLLDWISAEPGITGEALKARLLAGTRTTLHRLKGRFVAR